MNNTVDYSFYLFFYDYSLKDLLLDELNIKYPELKLSFSNKEFLSMKGPKGLSPKLKKDPIIFSTRQAIFIDKSKEQNQRLLSVKVGKEFWHYKVIEGGVDTFDFKEELVDFKVPARAYYKMQQAHKIFNLDINTDETVIEIGSAPGGISFYLLNLGCNVVCIDPAIMDQELLEKYQSKIKHIKKSIFDIIESELPKKCSWVISDLNLNGDLNINQSLKIIDLYPELKGAFLTIKTPSKEDIQSFSNWVRKLKKFSFKFVHLPAHKREIGVILKTKNK